MVKSFFKAAVAFVLITSVSGHAMASADLVSSTPESNAVVAAGPHQVDLKFSEGIELKLSKITVRGPKGRMTTTVGLDQNDKSFVFVSFWDALAPGKYTVDWHVVSSDKHKTHGTFTFSVKSEPASRI
jgi:copper resistance protein C